MKSFMAFEDILKPAGIKLVGFQCVDLFNSLKYTNSIFLWEPGMGKTVEAAAMMVAYANEVPNRRFIFIGRTNQLLQTPKKLHKFTGMKVAITSAESTRINKVLSRNPESYQILFITHESLNNPDLVKYLYRNKDSFYGVFVDEVHKLSNFTEASSAFALRSLLRHFPVAVGLTATPVTTNSDQIVDLVHMFQPGTEDDWHEYKKEVRSGRSVIEDYPELFHPRTRFGEGISGNYRVHVDEIEPHEHQIGAIGKDLFNITRGKGSYNQSSHVISLIRKYEDHRGLIYVRHVEAREWLESQLEAQGINYAVIHGGLTQEQKTEAETNFNSGNVRIVICTSTEALDLDSDFVIFYEYTAEIKQVIGRAERGLNPKTLDIHFMFTRYTGDADFFIRNIYRIGLWIQMVLKQDYRTILKIAGTVKKIQEESGHG